MRQTYQDGCIFEDSRRKGLWYVKYRLGGKLKTKALGRCGGEKVAKKKAAPLLLSVNEEQSAKMERGITLAELVKQYKLSDRFPVRVSTRAAYTSYLDCHIVKDWGEKRLKEIKAKDVETWLKHKKLAGKTKSHLRGLLHLLFEYAVHAEALPATERNPMQTVRVVGATKRLREPVILTADGFRGLLVHMREPYRTMAVTAMCLGLRYSELAGLKWGDVDWIGSQLLIRRGVVNGHADETKTEHSSKPVPLDSGLLEVWKRWRAQSDFTADSDFIFASPQMAGVKPYCHSMARIELRKAGKRIGLPNIGWHSFRHSYRTWLDATGAPVGVQQKLMRHGDIRTTMNIYGDALSDEMRQAHSKVVGMALRQELRK